MFEFLTGPEVIAKVTTEECPECGEKALCSVEGTPPLWCENCGWRGNRNDLATEVLHL